MLPVAIRFTLVLAVLTVIPSCNRSSRSMTSPTASAYSDGFEVVVFELKDKVPTNVRSVLLKEAEEAISGGALASIPGDPVAIQQQLSTGKSGDSRVLVTVNQLDVGKQQVRLTFEESSRTFVYEYAVEGGKITPLYSQYRDLGKSKFIRYTGK